MGKWPSAFNWSDRFSWCIHIERPPFAYKGTSNQFFLDAMVVVYLIYCQHANAF